LFISWRLQQTSVNFGEHAGWLHSPPSILQESKVSFVVHYVTEFGVALRAFFLVAKAKKGYVLGAHPFLLRFVMPIGGKLRVGFRVALPRSFGISTEARAKVTARDKSVVTQNAELRTHLGAALPQQLHLRPQTLILFSQDFYLRIGGSLATLLGKW